MSAPFLFVLLAILAITAALGLLVSKNPVSSALWLVLNLFSVAGLYLTMNAPFIAVIQVLVYAGAIMVLFLFVIMLLNLAALPQMDAVGFKRGLVFLVAIVFLGLLTFVAGSGLDVLPEPVAPEMAAANASASAIGKSLFSRYIFPFEVAGILLLVATIGAVLLARRVRVQAL